MRRAVITAPCRSVAEGLSLTESEAKVDLEDFRDRLCGTDPELQWGFDNYFIAPTLSRAYSIAMGEVWASRL